MTKKTLDKLHAECMATEKKKIEETTGKVFDDEDVEMVNDICRAILDLRDKYQIGNFDTHDCADEINAVTPLMHKLLGMHELYNAVLIEKNDDTGSKTRQAWKTINQVYGDFADASQKYKKTELGDIDKKSLTPDLLISTRDCMFYAFQEAFVNWQNYQPGQDKSKKDTPLKKAWNIFIGKTWELIFALEHKKQIDEHPTICSDVAFPEYDMTFKNGLKVDIKTSKDCIERHKAKYKDVAIWSPENCFDLNNHNFNEKYNGKPIISSGDLLDIDDQMVK